MKYFFITQHKNTWPISLQSKVLGVSRSGYYRYLKYMKGKAYKEHLEIIEEINAISKSSKESYGSRRMRHELQKKGFRISRKRTIKLMKEAGVKVRHKKKYKVTTDSNHKLPVFENLLGRKFQVEDRDLAYVSDITYIWTNEGWLYLAVVIDLFSRKVVGWSMNSRMDSQLVCDALLMALWLRRPAKGLIHHSDRGSQYASKKFRRLLKAYGVQGSMSRKGNCWDNAVAESFFGSLKRERVQWVGYQNRWDAQQDILNYITMFYNSKRAHSYLGYMCPNDYEQKFEKNERIA